ncbi:ECF transporter S component [candidate division KSB1 bacterium]|nr:ECF transporter S component [candidate division KSB1 bacterium]
MKFKTSDLTVTAFFIATIIVFGYLFLTIPNIELVTVTIFLAGYLLGMKKGIIVGVIAEFLFSLLNPMGMAAPPLLLAQVLSMGIVGAVGGFIYTISHQKGNLWLKIAQFAILGFLLTTMFDALTTVSFSVFMAETKKKILAATISSLIYGMPFYLTHILANTVIFALGLPVMIKAVEKIDYFKPRLVGGVLLLLCILMNYPESAAASMNSVMQDSIIQHVPEITVPDSVTQADTLIIQQPDTSQIDTSQKIKPQKIIFESDTTRFKKEWDSPFEHPQHEIHEYIYKDLSEVLSYLPGFFQRDLAYPGQPAYAYHRGLPSKYYSVFFNGHPIKDPHTNKTDLNVLPVESIQQIRIENEIQSRFFENAINIYSERYNWEAPYTRVYFHKGPSEFSDVDVTFGQKITPKMDAIAGLTLKGFSGPGAQHPNSLEQHTGRFFAEYRLSPGTVFLYSFLYNRIKAHLVGARQPSGEYATPNARSLRFRYDNALTLRQNILNTDFHNWITTLYFSALSNELNDSEFDIPNDYHYKYFGLNSVLYYNFSGHYLTATTNAEHTWTDAADIKKRNRTIFSIGLRDDFYFSERFGFRAQASVKGASGQGIVSEAGAGVFFDIRDRLKTTLGVLRTVRFPTLFELYTDEFIIGNPDLSDETIRKAYLEIDLQPFESLHLISQLYVKNVDDLLQYQFTEDESVTLTNGESDTYFGADIEGNWNLFWGLQLGSVASFVDLKDRFLEEVPRAMLFGYLQYENSFFRNDLHLTLRFDSRFWDERWGISSYGYTFTPDYVILPADAVINANAFIEVGPMKFYIAMENILDRYYELIYGYPRDGRTVHYGLRWEFLN